MSAAFSSTLDRSAIATIQWSRRDLGKRAWYSERTGMSVASGAGRRNLVPGLTIAVAAVIVAGFARNYYLRAWIGTRPISPMVHVHGFVMTAWVGLFLAQVLLVARQRTDIHRRLGILGACLAVVVLVLGIYTIAASIARQFPHASPALAARLFVDFDGVSLLLFAGLVTTALLHRRDPETHRRLMLVAMISLLPPAFGRLIAYFTLEHVQIIVFGMMCATVLVYIGLDTLQHRRSHPALLVAGALVLAVNAATYVAQVAGP